MSTSLELCEMITSIRLAASALLKSTHLFDEQSGDLQPNLTTVLFQIDEKYKTLLRIDL